MANVTAFELDDSVAATEDGVTLANIPGIWRKGEKYLPAALGLTLAELREAIKELGLPLREVKVGEGQAYDTFAPDDSNRFASSTALDERDSRIEPDEPVQGDPVQVDAALAKSEEIEAAPQEEPI